jgi:hypothetical protein
MKAIFVCIFAFFCLTTPVGAQDYIPMLEEGNRWNVLFENVNALLYRVTHVYKLAGDTVIEGKQYATVLKSLDREVSAWETEGFIREDIAAKRVYFRAYHSNWEDSIEPEGVLYDFGVSVGDTVTTIVWEPTWNKVERIDSVEIGGKYHKRITVGCEYVNGVSHHGWVKKNEWIEGIGNTYGILKPNFPYPGEPATPLLAFIRNGETVYNPFDYDTDFIWWILSNEQVETAPPVTVFASGKTLRIVCADAGEYAVDVFSLAGAHLLHGTYNANEVAVSLPDVPAGVYAVRIISGTRNFSKKIYLY